MEGEREGEGSGKRCPQFRCVLIEEFHCKTNLTPYSSE